MPFSDIDYINWRYARILDAFSVDNVLIGKCLYALNRWNYNKNGENVDDFEWIMVSDRSVDSLLMWLGY